MFLLLFTTNYLQWIPRESTFSESRKRKSHDRASNGQFQRSCHSRWLRFHWLQLSAKTRWHGETDKLELPANQRWHANVYALLVSHVRIRGRIPEALSTSLAQLGQSASGDLGSVRKCRQRLVHVASNNQFPRRFSANFRSVGREYRHGGHRHRWYLVRARCLPW